MPDEKHDMSHMEFLSAVAGEDVECLIKKEATYRGSWKKRGGVGAFMMLARKWDRIESMVETSEYGKYNIFSCVSYTGRLKQGEDGTMLAEIRDLRRYLLLVEAEMVARGQVTLGTPAVTVDRAELFTEGTPEDGGQHARQRVHLDDGMPEDRVTPAERREYYFRPTGGHGLLVNRYDLAPELWDHLPRLAVELNHKEYTESPRYYDPLYRWVEEELKWKMKEDYREHWARL